MKQSTKKGPGVVDRQWTVANLIGLGYTASERIISSGWHGAAWMTSLWGQGPTHGETAGSVPSVFVPQGVVRPQGRAGPRRAAQGRSFN